jgi:hypothetical protein
MVRRTPTKQAQVVADKAAPKNKYQAKKPEAREARKKDVANLREATTRLATQAEGLTPQQIQGLRYRISMMVEDHLEIAHQVLLGLRDWSPTQARLFLGLLNKVVPDISANFHEHRVVSSAEELSREQLEAIANGEQSALIIDHEAKDNEPNNQPNS